MHEKWWLWHTAKLVPRRNFLVLIKIIKRKKHLYYFHKYLEDLLVSNYLMISWFLFLFHMIEKQDLALAGVAQ